MFQLDVDDNVDRKNFKGSRDWQYDGPLLSDSAMF